ncbi:hypothetical protein VT84_30780 [Gemmata sp. SH-PL17]|uniref:dATP/dGTP diphosphohydrolase domain-containing protein n=1 Tax=Gemmata sp. SH-PL17 TaxID=1630693 RepID=UPI00078D475A|nr:dATP/dGTP diphosphohydrolase domain-containing protein [Gemmata sp. SH-PL17]AMV28819.1 hypothetical protein VT84_30780 [Gemmata sp. SH-PL17]
MLGIEGVGKDAPTVTNATGGKQSASPYRADLLPPHALLEVSKVLKEGADKYGENNWHKIPAADNVNHALVHFYAFLAGDASDAHLEHAVTRALFALDQVKSGRDQQMRSRAQEMLRPLTVSDFKPGERVRTKYGHPGTVIEYEDCECVGVRLDGSGRVCGWLPHTLAKI